MLFTFITLMLVYIYIYMSLMLSPELPFLKKKKKGLFKSHDEMEAATDMFFCIVTYIKWIIKKKKKMLGGDLVLCISCLIGY